MGLREVFQNPGAEFRSYPFWAWNEEMDPEEVARQIRSMKDAGVGGFFIHSRDGLETEYMGEKWMACVRKAVETARECGLRAWLYDEDRWPSGTAGGQVTALGDEYRLKGLTLEVCDQGELDVCLSDPAVRALYLASIDGMEIKDFQRLELGAGGERDEDTAEEKSGDKAGDKAGVNAKVKAQAGWALLVVRLEISAPSEWFNHQAPPDQLNPETVRTFLNLTHERYREAVGEAFGETVPGIFTDEPSLADRHAAFDPHRGWIPWSYGMEEYFQERRGYDFLDVLPYQYFNGEKSKKTRHDYWRTIAERYCESYSDTIGRWCREAGIAYTGHFLQEDKLGLCTRVNGSIMPHYVHQDVPGIDMLTERTEEYLTVKQCVSVAHQFGKRRVLTETYGCSGWDFDFEGQKWVGDWQYVLGINMRCTHMALSSLRGCRKRDYPPSFNYNNTWWEKNHVVEDYFARLGALLSEGEPIRDILLLHPASTAWSRLGASPYGNPVRSKERDVPEVDAYGYRFNALIEELCREHMDCDLGDESLLERYGWVKDGRIGIEKASYDMVVIPQIDTMFASTLRLLLTYLDQGGRVVVMEPLPVMIEGEADRAGTLKKLWAHPECRAVGSQEELIATLVQSGCRKYRITGQDGQEETNLLAQFRRTEDGVLAFLVNNNRSEACEADVELPWEGTVEEWDPLTGKISVLMGRGAALTDRTQGFKNGFHTRFEPAGSRLYYIKSVPREIERQRLSTSCPVRLDSLNVLTLDSCRYQLEEGPVSDLMEIWQAQCQVRSQLGMRQIHRNGLEQRYRWIHEGHENDGKELKLFINFQLDGPVPEKTWLAMEQPEQFAIFCNQEEVLSRPEGWFLDRAFEKVELPRLKSGENLLELRCAYHNDMELENCYLLGHFGVFPDRHLTAKPCTLAAGDWTGQGLFHYCGSVTYQYSYCWDGVGSILLNPGRWEAICLTARVGENTWEIPWTPGEPIDITAGLRPGRNQIEIQVVGSPRNMLGPLHLKGGSPLNTHDASFSPDPEDYTPAYQVVPYGLMEPPEIVKIQGG